LSRTKTYTISGLDADTDGIALSQAPGTGADIDILAVSQAIDATLSVNSIALDQTITAATPMTLTAGAASLIPPRTITLVSGAAEDFSAVHFVIVGFDQNGVAATESIVGPNNSTVSFAGFYSSVTSITPDASPAVITLSAGNLANSVPQQITLNGASGNGIGVVSDVFTSAKVTISSGSNQSARSFTIVGLGSNGLAQSEVLVGPNNGTVSSAYNYTRVDSVTPDDDAANNVSVGIGSTGAGLTLTAAAASLSPVRLVTLKSTSDLSGITFTIVGTDRWGNAVSEVVTGPNNETVTSKTAFATVTAITPSTSSASNVEAGWPIGGVTPWVLCGRSLGVDQVPEVTVSVLATAGSADGTLDVTLDMFPRLEEKDIDIDYTLAVTPGTPIRTQASGVRFQLTSGANTTAKVKFLRSGP
jgi:hypothetical protein